MSEIAKVEIDNLNKYLEDVALLSSSAEAQLEQLSGADQGTDIIEYDEIIAHYEHVEQQASEIHHVMANLEKASLPVVEKANVTYVLGRLKRLHLVTKNILRISRRKLGILDPEQLQEELDVHMMMNKPQ